MKPFLPHLQQDVGLGVLGGGQLGQMFVIAARSMGYKTIVYDPDQNSPAALFANEHICERYDDMAALERFAKACAAITVEFENIPVATLQYLHTQVPRTTNPQAVATLQDRRQEKQFLNKAGIATTAFCTVEEESDLLAATEIIEAGAILKTARLGYDGKGQCEVRDLESAQKMFRQFNAVPCILEQKVDLAHEVSVIVVRSQQGETTSYPVAENEHQNGILHTSCVPTRVDQTLLFQARSIGHHIAAQLDYCGVLGVEFFITCDNKLLVNEVAPRTHNSGHYTIDACSVSQFQQQVRVMCGLAPAEVRLLSPVVMVNLLGDLWPPSAEPDWDIILSHSNTHLHLYQKSESRVGRKMGHFCVTEQNIELAQTQAQHIYQTLYRHAHAGK